MQKEYFISIPAVSGSLEEEWRQCCDDMVEKAGKGYRPVKLNVFTDSADRNSLIKHKNLITESLRSAFGDQSPSAGITVLPPMNPFKVCAEGMYLKAGPAEIVTKYFESFPYVVITSGSDKEVWAAGLGDDLCFNDTRESAIKAFEKVYGILTSEGMTFNNIVRQWNFIGNILEVKEGFQNYQAFNEVRSEYYSRYRRAGSFPAATGIGMRLGGVCVDFSAITGNENRMIKAINNPNQVNAYQYSQQVLKGFAARGKTIKNPPQFERALFIALGKSKTLFVSGTASIIGQETIGKGNAGEQTLVTIENINKLKEGGYLGMVTGLELTTGKCSLIRVYVKNQEDFEEVKNICADHFPDVPSLFIQADICRDELLVEIEAEYCF